MNGLRQTEAVLDRLAHEHARRRGVTYSEALHHVMADPRNRDAVARYVEMDRAHIGAPAREYRT